jgi:hypothetical protein
MSQGYEHPKCYASKLGECSTKISNEHYFSRGVLDYLESLGTSPSVGVHWVSSTVQNVPLASWFQAKILCTHHNSLLAELDDEALAFFNLCERAAVRLLSDSNGNPSRWTINGDKLERWLVKSLCGFIVSGNATLRGKKLVNERPPLAWLRFLYGLDRMPKGCGLYCQNRPKDPILESGSLGFASLIDGQNHVYGSMMQLMGFRFLLAMITPNKGNFGEYFKDAVFHPSRFAFGVKGENDSATIDFLWADGPGRSIVTVVLTS